ncbi:MAG: chemotaxis protein CheB [Alphaproteobacteria bacterium]|nr:chemotaxis protein CheB [Alphaproteobacteria bacterium]
MATRNIIVIGASAGGVDALMRLCAMLPQDLPAAIMVAQHLSPSARSMLPALLDRAGPLSAESPVDGQAIEMGHVYVAPPDHHLLVRQDRLLVRRGPHENRTRPSVNALFRSAAVSCGGRVIGVVLTGLLDDGTEGLIAIKAAGGTAVVQDPADAEWPSMPRNALMRDHVDHVAPLAEIGPLLDRLCRDDALPSVPLPQEYLIEDDIAAEEIVITDPSSTTPGAPSHFSCPDCGGVLNHIDVADDLHFRCQVGHSFTPLGLADAQNSELERALAIAVRTHRDRVRLFGRMSDNAEARGMAHAGKRWRQAANDSGELVKVLEQATLAVRKSPGDGEG